MRKSKKLLRNQAKSINDVLVKDMFLAVLDSISITLDDGTPSTIGHDHDDRYYTKAETNLYFYNKSYIDSNFAQLSHSHLSSDITNFDEAVDDRISMLVQNGTGLSWSYDDTLNRFTPTVTLSPFNSDNLAEGVTHLYATATEKSNWNTAYSWGNHAGLYPLYNGTGATGTWGIDISGTSALANNLVNGGGIAPGAGNRHIDIDSTNGWAYLSLRKGGSTIWDIAQYDGGNLEIRPYGSSSNRTIFEANGNVTVSASLFTNNVYTNEWFRNISSLTGLYNQSNGNFLYSESPYYWTMATASTVAGGLMLRSGYAGDIKGYLYFNGDGFGLLHGAGGWSIRLNVGSVGGYFYGNWNMASGDLQMNDNVLKFDQSGTRSWYISASGGELNFYSGDHFGAYDFDNNIYIGGGSQLYFTVYGGGWYMSDTTWLRTVSSKSVWTGSGILASQGGISSGYGGASPNTTGGGIISGFLGIGLYSPLYQLDVHASTTIAARIWNNTAALVAYFGSIGNSEFSDLVLITDAGTGEIFKAGSTYSSYGGASSFNIYNSSGAIAFHTNGISNVVYIATSGNFNINGSNTDHGYKLYIGGTTYGTTTGSFEQLISRVATGTAPITVASTTLVSNLNAELWKNTTNNLAGGPFSGAPDYIVGMSGTTAQRYDATALASFLGGALTGYIRNAIVGDWQISNGNTSGSYTDATLELWSSYVSGHFAPRLSFHWAGQVASQIGMSAAGAIQILSGSMASYENLEAKSIYSSDWFGNTATLSGIFNTVNANYFYSSASNYWAITTASYSSSGGLLFRQGHEGTLKGYIYWDSSGFGLLHSAGGWAVRVNNGSTGGTLNGDWDTYGTHKADNFGDRNYGAYNVNLGSGGSEGRGLVAGYSGGSYGGIGYNVRHTTTGGQWIAPGGDTSNYLLFNQGFTFYGAGTGAGGRTLSFSQLGTLTNAGNLTILNNITAGAQVYWFNGYGFLSYETGKAIVGSASGTALHLRTGSIDGLSIAQSTGIVSLYHSSFTSTPDDFLVRVGYEIKNVPIENMLSVIGAYSASNPAGYITSASLTDTLNSVAVRGNVTEQELKARRFYANHYFGTVSANLGYPGLSSISIGARFILEATIGYHSAIGNGINNSMWFQVGGSTTGGYQWYHGATSIAELSTLGGLILAHTLYVGVIPSVTTTDNVLVQHGNYIKQISTSDLKELLNPASAICYGEANTNGGGSVEIMTDTLIGVSNPGYLQNFSSDGYGLQARSGGKIYQIVATVSLEASSSGKAKFYFMINGTTPLNQSEQNLDIRAVDGNTVTITALTPLDADDIVTINATASSAITVVITQANMNIHELTEFIVST